MKFSETLTEVKTSSRKAIEIVYHQEAKLWESRATASPVRVSWDNSVKT